MATFSSVSKQHVLQAIAEYDSRGGEEFLGVYGFEPRPAYTITYEGRRYDATAVLGVAHRFATGRLAPTDEVTGSMDGAVAILRKRGFEVSEPVTAVRAPVRRAKGATRAPVVRATATREAEAVICPTCSMTLPATGICDECG